MNIPNIPWKKFLGRNLKNEKKIEAKIDEAHEIKNAMTVDVLRIKKKVDKINENTFNKLAEISNDLGSVTYSIAIATGGKNRGLK
jgi:hypothetical protein